MELESVNKENELINENTLLRASEITSLISSVTLGPNSNYYNQNNNEIDTAKTIGTEKSTKTPDEKIKLQSDKSSKYPLDINDIKNVQQQMNRQSIDRQIEYQVRKKLEEKRIQEIERYKIIQKNLDLMKVEAERKHKQKIEELERKINQELELERQSEEKYQLERKDLAANTRKIQEFQEKERQLREQIRKWEEAFLRQEALFTKIMQLSNPELRPALDSYEREFRDLKITKESNKGSLEAIKTVCLKFEALCQTVSREIAEFDVALKIRIAQKEAEEEKERQIKASQIKPEVIVPIQIALVQPQLSVDCADQIPIESSSIQNELAAQYNSYRELLLTKKAQTKRLDETPELQQIRFALKFAVNNSINLLNEKNKSTLIDGHQKLFNLLSGQRINTSKGNVSVSDHNEALDWCKLRIAEKLIDRCDKESSLVFYSAAIITSLWQKFPDFGEIFKALLFKECPFLIPYKPTKTSNQSNEELISSWGYRLANGVCEQHVHYEGRTTKFAALLAALWITFPKRGENETSCNITHGWKYLSNLLNTTPDPNYLHIIGKLLEIAGFMFQRAYVKQFIKLMIIIRDKYIPTVHNLIDEETSASFNRLKETVAVFFATGKFIEPQGCLINGYW